MENQKNNVWKVAYYVGILLAVFLAVISIKELKSIGYVEDELNYVKQISVNGNGEVVAIPDIASFSFSVTENAKVIADAQNKASEKINKALDALKAEGIKETDLKTTSYSINPHYEYTQGICTNFSCPAGKSVLTGYDVMQGIEVKVRDTKKIGKVLEILGGLNVQNINGPVFSVDDIKKVKEQARNKAIENAQIKAKELSDKLGIKLGKITSFYDSSDDSVYPFSREGMGGDMLYSTKAAPAIAPQLPQGEQKIVVNVSITYQIK